ncbi:MAG: hypothetical protein LQ338_004084 [Usnochroma carphineum]|nr:MAG: hypothetical protein LQ338_004084 [Usnochroma carphineum]
MSYTVDPRKMPAMLPPPGVMPDFDTPSPWQTDVLRYGASKHQWNVNLVQIVRYANVSYMVNLLKADTERRKTGNILEIMHALLMLITKTAVLLQYLRIFTPVRNRRTYLTWLLMGVNIAVAFALALSVGLHLGEVTSGLVCCCLPCLPKLCRHTATQIKSTFRSSSSRRGDSSNGAGGKQIPRVEPNPYRELEEMQLSNKGFGEQYVVVSKVDMDPRSAQPSDTTAIAGIAPAAPRIRTDGAIPPKANSFMYLQILTHPSNSVLLTAVAQADAVGDRPGD